jgi:hypothetical protein
MLTFKATGNTSDSATKEQRLIIAVQLRRLGCTVDFLRSPQLALSYGKRQLAMATPVYIESGKRYKAITHFLVTVAERG